MDVLVTGANGYIGRRLIPSLLEEGHRVYAQVRDVRRFPFQDERHPNLYPVQADFLVETSLQAIPEKLDAAYYLVHSMGQSSHRFPELEARCAKNFAGRMIECGVHQVIYLSGIVNDQGLSTHLKSRGQVETILRQCGLPLTVLRSAIIIGSGSASFEIIRDLVEKLPLMVTPKWLKTKCQPIAIEDVIFYLKEVLLRRKAMGQCWDIGGPDVMNYRQMLRAYAEIRGLRRWIITLPVLTPRLSSYWLYFITSTSFPLARSLVDSMKNEVVCRGESINQVVPHQCQPYREALRRALSRMETNRVLSSWKDSVVSGTLPRNYLDFVYVPEAGTLRNVQERKIQRPVEEIRDRIWSIGGSRGWYFMNWAWELRGFFDKLVGGVGLRRGRKNQFELRVGDSLDFWRVVLADKDRNRLTLFAEMKLPGEAWLEFEISQGKEGAFLKQTATFRPKGILGRTYWFMLSPVHFFIFRGMIKAILHGPKHDPKKVALSPSRS